MHSFSGGEDLITVFQILNTDRKGEKCEEESLLFKVIAILIPSIFLFFIGNAWANSEPLKGWHEWESKDNVPLHKTWSIEFNQVVG